MPEDSPLPESATTGKCEGRLYSMKFTIAKKSAAEGLNITQIARYLGASYGGTRLLYEASQYPVVQRQAAGSVVEQFWFWRPASFWRCYS